MAEEDIPARVYTVRDKIRLEIEFEYTTNVESMTALSRQEDESPGSTRCTIISLHRSLKTLPRR